MSADGTSPVESPTRRLINTTLLSCEAQRWDCPGGTIVVLRVLGEIDLLTCPALQAALDAARDGAVDPAARHLVVDLAGVTFCCVRGFGVLAGYVISGMPPLLERHARLLWADAAPIRSYRSAAAAVTAIRVEHAREHPA